MLYRTHRLICLSMVAVVLISACSSGATPAPTATPPALPPTTAVQPPATVTTAPAATSTTSAPTATSTPEPTIASPSTPATEAAPAGTPQPSVDPIVDRQLFNDGGVSIAYPGAWQVGGQAPLIIISSPDLVSSGRQAGAELMIGASPLSGPNASLHDRWNDFATQSPNVTLSAPAPTTLGGEEALTSLFSDQSDGSHGWVTISGHGGQTWFIITQAIPKDNWPNYQAMFGAMLRTFRFTQ
jgi:hypothetical protein